MIAMDCGLRLVKLSEPYTACHLPCSVRTRNSYGDACSQVKGGHDAGGLYRELWSIFSAEIMSNTSFAIAMCQ